MLSEGLQLGRYRILRLIGRGGAGDVYLAEDQRIRRQVALKVVQSEAGNSEATKDATSHFQREAQTIAVLSHPNILPLFDFGEEVIGGVTLTYLVTPFCPEGSLVNWLRQRYGTLKLPPEQVEHIVRQAADALDYAHDKQIVHRDVKPSNFLIRSRKDTPDRPDLLLADFGIARLTQATLNMSKTIRGTPVYMAPEQWSGDATIATDQYSLAIMAYELLTGHPPFQGTQEQVMYRHLMTPPLPPSAFNPHISPSIDAVILRALAKQPEARFPSIAGFARAFREASAEAVPPPSLPSISSPIVYEDATMLSPLLVSVPSLVRDTPHISVPPVQSNDFYTTLTISTTEALAGVRRTLTLPGKQRVQVAVPAGAHDGQIIRLDGQIEAPSPNAAKGNLIVTIAVVPSSESAVIEAIPDLPPVRINWRSLLFLGLALLIVIGGIAGLSSLGISHISRSSTGAAHSGSTGSISPIQASATAVARIAQATALAQSNATATAAVTANPYDANLQTLAWNDPLSKNSGAGWDEVSGSCAFEAGGYHVIASSQSVSEQVCVAHKKNFADFTFQVQMNIVKGSGGGILLRSTASTSYYLRIKQDGTYTLLLCGGAGTSCNKTLTGGISSYSSYIAKGQNHPNLIAVVAKTDQIYLYVNNTQIDFVNDSSSLRGQIGVVAEAGSEIVFRNATVWT